MWSVRHGNQYSIRSSDIFKLPSEAFLIVQCFYDTSGFLTCIINQLPYNFIKEKSLQLTPEQQWGLGVRGADPCGYM